MYDVLFVDDDVNLLQGLTRSMRGNYRVHTASGGQAALDLLATGKRFAVIVSDQQMPSMDGVTFLARAQKVAPDSVRVMLTGNADQATAVKAVNDGAIFRFVTKPCASEDLIKTVNAAIRQFQLVDGERQLLENTLLGAIQALTQVLSLSDAHLGERSRRLKERVGSVAASVPGVDRWVLESTALLAQLGMAAVPAVVLARHRKGHLMTPAENEILARVPEFGFELLANIPRLDGVASAVRYQHKNFDGTGLPKDAVAGEAIPVAARVLAIARDAAELDAEGVDFDAALQALAERVGRYDPKLLPAVLGALRATWGADRNSRDGERRMTVATLAIGHVLAQPVLTTEGTVLLVAGQEITAPVLERLRNFAKTVGVRDPIVVQGEKTSIARV
jgi:response regulator RpfG family c-di-GMP phosphodiesterase